MIEYSQKIIYTPSRTQMYTDATDGGNLKEIYKNPRYPCRPHSN